MGFIFKERKSLFDAIAYVFFHRGRSLCFCLLFMSLSLVVEISLKVPNFFSSSGAIVTLAGLFLNIKHSLYFHLKIPKENIYHSAFGNATFAKELTDSDLKKVDELISDEIYGVSFMVIGTLIWSYGSFFVGLIVRLLI